MSTTGQSHRIIRRRVVATHTNGIPRFWSLELSCGHFVSMVPYTNRVPNTVTCHECSKAADEEDAAYGDEVQ